MIPFSLSYTPFQDLENTSSIRRLEALICHFQLSGPRINETNDITGAMACLRSCT